MRTVHQKIHVDRLVTTAKVSSRSFNWFHLVQIIKGYIHVNEQSTAIKSGHVWNLMSTKQMPVRPVKHISPTNMVCHDHGSF